jgi:Large polyvalent protein associated domain 38
MRLGAGHDTGIRKTDLATMLDSPAAITAFWQRVKTIARASKAVSAMGEDVQRFALYDRLIEQGVPKDAAAYAARDLEDFTLHGAGTVVRFVTQTVPFMNAWLQGLYKVGRSASNADVKLGAAVGMPVGTRGRVALVLGAQAMATLALDALYQDDEDYKKRPEYDRNSNYWFKFGGVEFRIPMGFEIAAMSRIAANGVEAFFGTNEMTTRRFLNNVGSIALTNMAMNPTPQIVKPLLDVAMNQTGTGQPIVTQGMEKLRPEAQYNAGSTLLARGISSVGNTAARGVFGPQASFPAPVQLDYLTNAYFGWLGTMAFATADRVARGVDQAQAAVRGVPPMEPVRPAMDMWNFATAGMVSTQTTPQSRYVDMLYQQADGINRAFATYHDMIERGRVDDARDFYSANKEQINKHELVGKVTQVETTANRQIKRIGESPNLSAEQKRVEIMKYNAMRNRGAENVFGARP